MKLQYRINLLTKLGNYLHTAPESWKDCVERAYRQNAWFTPGFVETGAGLRVRVAADVAGLLDDVGQFVGE